MNEKELRNRTPDYTCPSAKGHPYGDSENAKRFRIQGDNGDLCCDFCGSYHPVQFMRLIDRILRNKGSDGVYLSTGKPGKLYINRPEVKNSDDGAIKFYINHLFAVPEYYEERKGEKWLKQEIVDKVNKAVKISKEHFNHEVLPKIRADIAHRKSIDNRN